jgi:DNA-directed RNA polymerase sigma subunit (sigma70/sigma32)
LSRAAHEGGPARLHHRKDIADRPPEPPSRTGPLDAASETRLVGAARAGDEAARAALVDALTPAVRSMARRYRATGARDQELIGAGTGALLQALERYDAEQGTRFWPYASWWVRHAMRSLGSPPEP